MNEYYNDLKKAIMELEKFTAGLEKDNYDFLYSSLKRISNLQKDLHP